MKTLLFLLLLTTSASAQSFFQKEMKHKDDSGRCEAVEKPVRENSMNGNRKHTDKFNRKRNRLYKAKRR